MFENKDDRTLQTKYYLPAVEIKDSNVMIDWQNFFESASKDNFISYNNIRKIPTGEGDDCTTGCLLDYPCLKNYYEVIPI